MISSYIPDANYPFLLNFIEKTFELGGKMCKRYGYLEQFITFTLKIFNFPFSKP